MEIGVEKFVGGVVAVEMDAGLFEVAFDVGGEVVVEAFDTETGSVDGENQVFHEKSFLDIVFYSCSVDEVLRKVLPIPSLIRKRGGGGAVRPWILPRAQDDTL